MSFRTLAALFAALCLCAAPALAADNAVKAKDAAPEKTEKKESVLKTTKERVSYTIGINMAHQIKNSGLATDEIDTAMIERAIKDILGGKESLLSVSEMQETMKSLQDDLQKRAAEKAKKEGEKNKAEGEKFLAENAKKAGVKTLPSGLQYKVLTDGPKGGKSPTADNTVECNYRGTLVDGKEFDSSAKQGKPVSFGVKQVIAGWTEALQLMKPGDKWELYLPASLAYGDKGTPGGPIAPNSALVFEVELIKVK